MQTSGDREDNVPPSPEDKNRLKVKQRCVKCINYRRKTFVISHRIYISTVSPSKLSLSLFPQLKPSLQRGGSSASLHNSTMRNTIFQLMIHTLDPLGEGEYSLIVMKSQRIDS